MAVSDVIVRLALQGASQFRRDVRDSADGIRSLGRAGAEAEGGLGAIERASQRSQRAAADVATNVAHVGDRLTLFASLPIAAGLLASTKAASDLNETVSFSQVVFGDAADEMERWASNALGSLGLARESALDAANGFGNLFQGIGATAEQSAGLSQRMVQLAVDMSSAKNVPLSDSLGAIQSGLIGEVEPLRRFGVLLSEARVQQFALSHGIASGNGALTEAQKVQARYGLILEGTSRFQGDYARTSDSAANATRRAGQAAIDAAADLGNSLAPVLARGADVVTFFAERFQQLPGAVQTGVVALGLLAAAAGPVLSIVGRVAALRLGTTTISSVDALRQSLEALTESQLQQAAASAGTVAAATTVATSQAGATAATVGFVASEEALAAASGEVQLALFGAASAVEAEGLAAIGSQGALFSVAAAEGAVAAGAGEIAATAGAASAAMEVEGAAATVAAIGLRARAAAALGSIASVGRLSGAIVTLGRVAGPAALLGGLIEGLRHLTGQADQATRAMERLQTVRSRGELVRTFEGQVDREKRSRQVSRSGLGQFLGSARGDFDEDKIRRDLFTRLASENLAAATRLRDAMAESGQSTAGFDAILARTVRTERQHASDAQANAAATGALGASASGAAGSITALGNATEDSGAALKRFEDNAKALAEADKAVVDGEKALRDAHQDVVDAQEAVAQHSRDVADARRDVADAARAITDAERGVVDAHRAVADAQREAVRDARELARAREDLADADQAVADAERQLAEARARVPRDLADAELDLREAALAVAEAQEDLLGSATDPRWEELASDHPAARAAREAAKALEEQQGTERDGARSATEVARAQITLERAQNRLADTTERLNELRSAGDRPQSVVSAERAVADAIERRADQQERVNDLAERDPSARIVEARRGVRDAEERVEEATRRHGDAVRRLNDLLREDPYVALRDAQAKELGLLHDQERALNTLKDAYRNWGITSGPIIDEINRKMAELHRQSIIAITLRLDWDPNQVSALIDQMRLDVTRNILEPQPVGTITLAPPPAPAPAPTTTAPRPTTRPGIQRAGGGDVRPGLYVVGERGPEAMVIGRGTSGWVYPHDDPVTRLARGEGSAVRDLATPRADGGPVDGSGSSVAWHSDREAHVSGWEDRVRRVHWARTTVPPDHELDTFPPEPTDTVRLGGRRHLSAWRAGARLHIGPSWLPSSHEGDTWPVVEHGDREAHVSGYEGSGRLHWARSALPDAHELDTFPPEPGQRVSLEGRRHLSAWDDEDGRVHVAPSWLPRRHEGDTWPIIAAARGYVGTVRRPTVFVAGERGSEDVAITPRGAAPPGADFFGGSQALAANHRVASAPSASPGATSTRQWDLTVNQHYAREPRDLDFVRTLRLAQNLWGDESAVA